MMVGSHDELQSETGYIDARPHPPDRRKSLATHGRTIHVGQSRPNGNLQERSAFPPTAEVRAMFEYRRCGRVEDRRGSLGPIGQRPVSYPRSSNWTCRFPASSSPTGFTARYTTVPLVAGVQG